MSELVPSKPRASILILTTNQPELLRTCLAALAADGSRTSREIILVLNAVADDLRAIAQTAAGVRIIDSPVNLGIPGGFNRARSCAHGEYLCFLHDDTVVAPGWLDRLVATLDERPEAGIVGGLVLNPDGSLQNAGSVLWRDGWARLSWWGPSAPAPESFVDVDAVHTVASSFSMVRAATFDRIGGLDEALHPGYFTDVTLGMGIREQGQVVLLDPRARAVHHRSQSTEHGYRTFVIDRNHRYFCARWRATLDRDHEPFVDTPAAYAASHERARSGARMRRMERRWEQALPSPRFELDAGAQALRLAAAEAAVRTAWAEELERRLAAAEPRAAPPANEYSRARAAWRAALRRWWTGLRA